MNELSDAGMCSVFHPVLDIRLHIWSYLLCSAAPDILWPELICLIQNQKLRPG